MPNNTDYLRSLIARSGLSQRGAARAIGINQRTLRHYLTGKNPCPDVIVRKLESLPLNNGG